MFGSLLVLAVVASAAPLTAAAAPAAGTPCELHLWPAERMGATAFYLYNGLIQGRASKEQIEGSMDDLLGPTVQLAALRAANPIGTLGLPATTRLVEHAEPLDRKSLNKVKTRRATSASPCYAELIVMDHGLIEDIVWGDRFLSTFMFRDFGAAPQVKRTIKGTGGNKLKVLTLNAAARPDDAPQLVGKAVEANFLEYAKNARPKIAGKI